MTFIFKNKFISYFLITILGISNGLSVAFFSNFPNNTLWGFSYFSSSILGFWIFTTSLIVLYSEKRIVSGVNAFLYVYFVFLVTGIFKSIRAFHSLYSLYDTINEMILGEWWKWLLYGCPALICMFLALILWQGRKNTKTGKIILWAPAFVIGIELIQLYVFVIRNHTHLFVTLLNSICFLLYLFIFKKQLFNLAK